MPDLTLETYRYCSSVENFEMKIKDYIITYGRKNVGQYQYNWHCTCKGFQFRKRCKHVEQAQLQLCGWDEFVDPEKSTDGKCPRCGSELLTRLVGV